eukprot:6203641-Pyramimonas_sp.AAC.1
MRRRRRRRRRRKEEDRGPLGAKSEALTRIHLDELRMTEAADKQQWDSAVQQVKGHVDALCSSTRKAVDAALGAQCQALKKAHGGVTNGVEDLNANLKI